MKNLDNNIGAFLALVRGGLWEQDVNLSSFGDIDFMMIYRLAEEQSVIGLVTAGLEHVQDIRVPQPVLLQFIGQTIQLEQRNKAMNIFIASIIERLRSKGIYTLLVKGQGVAQCYNRPLWRACGDVDLFLDKKNYKDGVSFFNTIAEPLSNDTKKNLERLNTEYQIGEWLVELHGTQHANLSIRMDKAIDQIQNKVFSFGKVRVWRNNNTDVFLPSATEDVIFVFAHILQHLFLGGIGLRQICDWTRLIWEYRESLDLNLLKTYVENMGVMSEWRVFSSIAVDVLGMQPESVPFYKKSYIIRANHLFEYCIEVGNLGHNKDNSYASKYKGVTRKILTMLRQSKDSLRLSLVFPLDSPRFLVRFIINGIKEFF